MLHVLTWAAILVLVIAVTIWTVIWMRLFLFADIKESMSIGIFPTLTGAALILWLIRFSQQSQGRDKGS